MIEQLVLVTGITGFQWHGGDLTEEEEKFLIENTPDGYDIEKTDSGNNIKISNLAYRREYSDIVRPGDFLVKDCNGLHLVKEGKFNENYDYLVSIEGN